MRPYLELWLATNGAKDDGDGRRYDGKRAARPTIPEDAQQRAPTEAVEPKTGGGAKEMFLRNEANFWR
jgi:hypothetical protein